MAGRFGDGWPPAIHEERAPRAPRRSGTRCRVRGKGLSDLRVAPIVRGIAMADREAAREKARSTVAFLLGAYGPYYGNSVAEQGYSDVVEEIRAAWEERDTDAMAQALPEDVLDESWLPQVHPRKSASGSRHTARSTASMPFGSGSSTECPRTTSGRRWKRSPTSSETLPRIRGSVSIGLTRCIYTVYLLLGL